MFISREIRGERFTVVFDDGDGATGVTFYCGADRVATGVWDGEDFAPRFSSLAEDAYAALAAGVRERLSVIAGGGLAPWDTIVAALRALSTEALAAAHAQVAVLALATASMPLDDDGARLDAAAKLEVSAPAGGAWSQAERVLMARMVGVLRERAFAN